MVLFFFFKALAQLTAVLKNDACYDSNAKAHAAWTLGMIGQHSSKHSKFVCACGAVEIMMDVKIKNEKLTLVLTNTLSQYLHKLIFIRFIWTHT